METTKFEQIINNERSEEVQHIIERMPTKFGYCISSILFIIFLLLMVFGWVIRYPDIVSGQIVINTKFSPTKLVANVAGKLKLGKIKSLQLVREGEIIAYIENATTPGKVYYIDSIIKQYSPNSDAIIEIEKRLPKNASLGELNVAYYSFLSNLQQVINHKIDGKYQKQEEGLSEMLNVQSSAVAASVSRVQMSLNALNFVKKFYARDSLLFLKKVISESELDKSQMSYISAKDAYQNSLNTLLNAKQQVQQTNSRLQELSIAEPEKNKELKIALISSYNELVDQIKVWEQKYVFKAPYKGIVQFSDFYAENQFISLGEKVFTVIPKKENAIGQLILPALGSGKIQPGQEVIVKLDNFPYMEYGSITGKVNSISLTSNKTKANDHEIETYQVLVDFPNQLKTNYGTILDFKAQSLGTAEIITNNRRLVHRLFDNLRYITNR
ncbi:hemolysin D [Pedobacter sp. KBW01]|uniref:HlyD family efflux transporter periplasmic adaptor subunit n=1 Tax=Pedobacter sp. KBW01 TaxID=2153364 RepID=UPI000F59FC9D|nr:HlyD family efflux transporter periplasmic adaptor subunit [Pedobacter sp. KBW01]RQO64411.1 hemolysin D [Pedobacter sp. KBW01]